MCVERACLHVGAAVGVAGHPRAASDPSRARKDAAAHAAGTGLYNGYNNITRLQVTTTTTTITTITTTISSSNSLGERVGHGCRSHPQTNLMTKQIP